MARQGAYEWSIDIIADDVATLDRERLDMDVLSDFFPPTVYTVGITSRAYLRGLRSLCHIVMRPDEARPAVDRGPGTKSVTLLLVTMDEEGRTSDMSARWARARPDLIPRTVVSVRIPEVVDEAAMNAMLRWRCQLLRKEHFTPRVVFSEHDVTTSDETLWSALCRPRDEEHSLRLVVAGASWLLDMPTLADKLLWPHPGAALDHIAYVELFAAGDQVAQAAMPTADETRLSLDLRKGPLNQVIAVMAIEEGGDERLGKVLAWLEGLRWPSHHALVLQVPPQAFPVCGCGDFHALQEFCRRRGVGLMITSDQPRDIVQAMLSVIWPMVRRHRQS
jgi:hypothetical protein